MKIKNKLIILTSYFMIFSTICFSYEPYGYNKNSLTARYYRGEISADEYLDSKGIPSGKTTTGTIYHSDGSKSIYYETGR